MMQMQPNNLHNLDYYTFSNYHQPGTYDGSRTDARKTSTEYFIASGNVWCVICYIIHTCKVLLGFCI